MKPNFTLKVAKEIADISFGYVLDCMMGYSSDAYDLSCDPKEYFEQNFIEDLEERGFVVTDNRIAIICNCYDKIRAKFELRIRKLYYGSEAIGLGLYQLNT
jgi:hypothetical protein